LNTVANRCVEFFPQRARRKNEWNLHWKRELFGARFDEAKVQQALTKILENAVEAVGLAAAGQIAVQRATWI
jgi:C4-dicarboxylate-specific signal transduction histidine kinase